MRSKIIFINAAIVIMVGLLAYWITRASVARATGDQDKLAAEARHDVQGAAALFQLEALSAERWLVVRAAEPASVDPLTKATPVAQNEAAMHRCDDLANQMKGDPVFRGSVPTLVVLVDASGHTVGRNGSNIGRGEDLASPHPGLRATLASGKSGSEIWSSDKENYLASYAGLRDEAGKVIGAVVMGRPLNDTLTHVSEETTGRPLVVVLPASGKNVAVAHSASASKELDAFVTAGAKDAANGSSHSGVSEMGEIFVATAALSALGDGGRAMLLASSPRSLIADPGGLVGGILGATALGVILAIIAGWLLGNYITRPIDLLEEGLLAILNGQTDRRFELDHPELGGLAFRIDQLINQLMGVEEDNTDAEGRVSSPPDTAHFTDALAVDDKRLADNEAGGTATGSITRLATESEAEYYSRIYREYIAAKRSIGEATDHITEVAFSARIKSMEADASQKYGRPVRYQVQARAKEVVLLAVPMP